MNLNHEVDMRRPFADEYVHARKDVRFWHRLSFPTQQAIVMFFSDYDALLIDIEKECGCAQGAVRNALTTRGLYDVSAQRSKAMMGNTNTGRSYTGPMGSSSNLGYKRPTYGGAAQTQTCDSSGSGTLSGAIHALEGQLSTISTKIRQLSTEWDKLNAALTTLKGL